MGNDIIDWQGRARYLAAICTEESKRLTDLQNRLQKLMYLQVEIGLDVIDVADELKKIQSKLTTTFDSQQMTQKQEGILGGPTTFDSQQMTQKQEGILGGPTRNKKERSGVIHLTEVIKEPKPTGGKND